MWHRVRVIKWKIGAQGLLPEVACCVLTVWAKCILPSPANNSSRSYSLVSRLIHRCKNHWALFAVVSFPKAGHFGSSIILLCLKYENGAFKNRPSFWCSIGRIGSFGRPGSFGKPGSIGWCLIRDSSKKKEKSWLKIWWGRRKIQNEFLESQGFKLLFRLKRKREWVCVCMRERGV